MVTSELTVILNQYLVNWVN